MFIANEKKKLKRTLSTIFCILADKANLSTNYQQLVQISNGGVEGRNAPSEEA